MMRMNTTLNYCIICIVILLLVHDMYIIIIILLSSTPKLRHSVSKLNGRRTSGELCIIVVPTGAHEHTHNYN